MTDPLHPLHVVTDEVNRTEPWQWRRVLAVLDHCTARPFARRVLEQRRGAHRVLTADAFLAAYLAHAMFKSTLMHQTLITNTVRGWTPSQRHDVGLDPHTPITYKMITDAFEHVRRACESAAYPDWDARRFAQALLDASLWTQPPTGAFALDSTDIPTWGRLRFRRPAVDSDPDAPPPENQSQHPLPDAPKGPDGRYIYTCDLDARVGWRSASQDETEFFCGYDAHVITDVAVEPASAPGHLQVPHVARSAVLAPAGTHKGDCGWRAVVALGDTPAPRELMADRAYNYTTASHFTIPLWRAGYTTIFDLHEQQRGRRPGPVAGTQWIDGTLYTTCLPEGLVDIAPMIIDPDKRNKVNAEELERLHQLRAAYAFTPHGVRQPDGRHRFRGPAVTHPKIRSPRAPRSMREDFRKPTVYCTDGKTCGCAITVTLYDTDEPNTRMPFQHGTIEWADSYHRRVGIESVFSDLKANRLHLARGGIRGFGLTRYSLMLGFALAAMNLLILRDWHAKRERLDPWGALLGEPPPPTPHRDRHPATGRRSARTNNRRTTVRPDR